MYSTVMYMYMFPLEKEKARMRQAHLTQHLRGPALISTQFHPTFKIKKFKKGHPELTTHCSIRAHFRDSIEFCSFTRIRKDFYSLPDY